MTEIYITTKLAPRLTTVGTNTNDFAYTSSRLAGEIVVSMLEEAKKAKVAAVENLIFIGNFSTQKIEGDVYGRT